METTCDGLLIRKFIVKNSVEISHLSSPLEPTFWTYFLSGECLFHDFDDPKLKERLFLGSPNMIKEKLLRKRASVTGL